MQQQASLTDLPAVKTLLCLMREIALYPVYEPPTKSKLVKRSQERELALRKKRIQKLRRRFQREVQEYRQKKVVASGSKISDKPTKSLKKSVNTLHASASFSIVSDTLGK